MSERSKKKTKPQAPPAETAARAAATAAAPRPSKPYFAGIDILKILAAFFVVSIHTFLYSGFYDAAITDRKFMIPIAYRWISYTCVPIFMTVTGYLMKNKKLSAKYYLGLVKIIVIYLFISILCMRTNHEVFGTQFTPWSVLKGYLEYSNANYAWYVNYYIALFCLIPFLNLAFNGLENKKQRLTLVVTITFLTIFARSLFIGFELNNQSRVFPDYLNGMWPLAYYYAGAFIREYPPKKCLRNKVIFLAVLAAAIAFLTETTYRQSLDNAANGYRMLSWHFNDYGTYPVFIATVCIFLLLFDITSKNKGVKFVLGQLSGTTFGLYLISYVFDRKIYADYSVKFPPSPEGVWNFDRWTHVYQPLLYVFLNSLLWALVIHNVYNLLEYLVKLGISKIKNKNASETPET